MADQNSQFYAILTNVGAAKQANADALGIAWKITQLGVGDANGTEPTPNATQTALIAEWRRAPLNQLKVDDNDSSIIVAEQIIPAEVGGKWIREIGLYDADGDLVAVANCPPTYKPLLSQGSGRTQVVRMNLIVSSSSNVELKIDPSVVLATREWVTSELAKQDFKHSVVAATTANITLSGLQTIDGVALTAGSRVLVKNQTTGKDNGLYVVASAAWTRSADADISAEVTPGMLVLVERGTVNGDSAWQLVTDGPITLGTTALAYEMAFGRTGVTASTYRSVTVDAYGRVVAATNPTTVAGYGLTDVYTKTQIDQALALKAPLASPTFTGQVKVPTPAAGNNSDLAANTAFVMTAIAQLIASSPAALDTLNELAAALGNDPNFAATMTNALALKAPLASPNFTGDPKAPTPAVTDNDASLATTAFVRALMGHYGLGAASADNVITNIDTVSETGVYMVTGTTAGVKPTYPAGLGVGAIANGTLLHMERWSSNMATQIWDSLVNTTTPIAFIRTRNSNGIWSEWGQLWTSLNTPKQTSASDVAAGAMMVTGSFGQGVAIMGTAADLNSYVIAGNYITPLTGLLNIPPGWSPERRYSLEVKGYSPIGQYVVQVLTTVMTTSVPLMAVRTMAGAGEWSAWQVISLDPQLPYRGHVYYKTAGVYSWTVPAGVYKVQVEVRGGGGSGAFGWDGSTTNGPGGGGGGGISKRLCQVTPGSVITVTVGAGGAYVATEGANGNAGGASSFGSFCSATGGAGGYPSAGAVSGVGIGGDFNAGLGMGAAPVRNSAGTANWGGAGGGGESTAAAMDTSTLTQPGMGGGGRTKNRSQAGADGCVFITY
ncbi:hypothetical protein D3C78_525670 [compost metagenome]